MTDFTDDEKIRKLIRAGMMVFMFLPVLAVSWYLDNDSWFLFAHGRYILENGFPYIEPFTIHEGLDFVMQQWLSAVLYWLIYRSLGKWGIIIFLHVSGGVLIWIMYRFCMVISNDRFYLSVIITTCSALPVCLWFMVARPQVFTYIILLFELLSLEKYIKTSDWRRLIPLPVLSLLEINLHSAMWFLMFAFIVPYIIDDFWFKAFFIKSEKYKKLPIIIAAMLMFTIGFVNPYGLDAMTYVFRSYGNELISSSVAEMCVPDITSLTGKVVFLIIFIVVLSYILNRTGKITLRYFILTLGTIYMVLSAIKSIPYFIIGSVLPLACLFENHADKLTSGRTEHLKRTLYSILGISCAVICIAVIACLQDYSSDKDYICNNMAIDWLTEEYNTEDISLYTGYTDGAYAEYMGIHVYIDPRAEVFLKENNKKFDYFSEYITLQSGDIYYKDFLDKYRFTHILVSEKDILYTYLQRDDDYVVVYEDSDCRIYIQRTGVA